MAYASVTYTSASGTTFALTNSNGDPIPYIRQSDIKVYVNTVLQTLTTDYTFNTAGTAIVLNSAVSGATVLLQRITDIADPTVVYTAGSTLTAQDLNNADNQIRYGLQEFQDSVDAGGGVPDGDKGDISVGGNGTIWTVDNGAVTEAKIASGAVTETKIGTGAVTSTKIANDTIVNADINSAAAIAYSKLNLTGSVVDADISASAEIAVSKLADGTARQLLQTDAAGTGVEWTNNVDIPGTLDVTGNTTLDGNLTVGGSFDVTSLNGGPLAGTRNRIINGDMRIDQRNNGASVTTVSGGGYYFSTDRFITYNLTGVNFTTQRVAEAPAGFTHSAKLTFANTFSLTSTGEANFQQLIEGFNVADLGWGTASAQPVAVSFWVRASFTGTFSVGFANASGARAYATTYSINAANTWEYKTVTVPGDTSGTWATDNTIGLLLRFMVASGSNFVVSANNTWTTRTGAYNAADSIFGTRAIGAASGISAGSTWQITGVQLEPGTVATPFERIDYSESLRRCQRYYEKSFNQDVAPANGVWTGYYLANVPFTDSWVLAVPRIEFKVPKRAVPTITTFGSNGLWQVNNNSNGWDTLATINATGGYQGTGPVSQTGFSIGIHNNASSGYATGYAKALRGDWTASAEL